MTDVTFSYSWNDDEVHINPSLDEDFLLDIEEGVYGETYIEDTDIFDVGNNDKMTIYSPSS